MSYEIGACSGGDDLLTKIKAVAVTKGWSAVYDAPFGPDRWVVLSMAGVFFHLLYTETIDGTYGSGLIRCAMSTAFDSSKGFDSRNISSTIYTGQVGASNAVSNQEPTMLTKIGSMASYRIFSDTNYLTAVAELTPGFFTYLSMGIVEKYGTYTGGHYISASKWATTPTPGIQPNAPEGGYNIPLFDDVASGYGSGTVFYADITEGPWFFSNNPPSSGRSLFCLLRDGSKERPSSDAVNYLYQNRSPNAFNQIAVLQPSTLYVYRANGLSSPVGEIRDFRPINITNYNAGDIITLGADEWHVFPAAQKTAVWNVLNSAVPSSGLYGVAFRKVV